MKTALVYGAGFIGGHLVIFLLSYVIHHWLPLYRGSLPFMKIFYFGAIFTSSNLVGVVISAANRQMLGLYQGGIIVVISYILVTLLSSYSKPIIWYAYVNISIQFITFICTMVISYCLIRSDMKKSPELLYS